MNNLAEARCESHTHPRVSLSTGCVEGLLKTTALGRPYYSFKGIPYAAPPIGNLRFKAPRPPIPWSGVLTATKEPPACLQPWRENLVPIYFSEDCLFLNVFTPYLKHPSGKPMAVIMWIHGGKHYQSSSSTYQYGPDFLLMKDVVVVNINFRLGIFGYLNLNVSEAQGNAALKDIVAALRWVQQEIGKFGGDSSRVAIMGGSSGGSDVTHLYISSMARGLFHSAISQSGSALCDFSFIPSTASYALRVAASLGCPTHDPLEVVSCLRNIHGSVLAEQQMIVGGAEGHDLPFLPTIEMDLGEEVFLPDAPMNLISRSGNVPYLIGFNNAEGLMYVSSLEEYEVNNMKEEIVSYLPDHMVRNTNQAVIHEVVSRVDDFYFGQGRPSVNDSLYGFINFMTDKAFSFCTLKTVEALSARAPVYLYYFTFQGKFQRVFSYKTLKLQGVCHGDELGYLFYRNILIQAHNNVSLFPRDMAMVEKAVNLWTNFATYGNPTPFLEAKINTTWRPASASVNSHLVIGETLEMVHNSLLKKREVFWESLYCIVFIKITPWGRKEEHFLMYSVMCLLGLFSFIIAISYYIQYRQERNHSLYIEL